MLKASVQGNRESRDQTKVTDRLMNTNASTPTPASRALGCFLGGAVGDALGAAVEFLSLDEIRGRFGENGVQDFTDARSPAGYITDDTQMTLFTAEGMIRAHNRFRTKGICNPGAVIHMAYYRWLHTQGHTPPIDGQLLEYIDTGWLVKNRALHQRMAPGMTVMASLLAPGTGLSQYAENNSKGCGGVMRVAPIGLAASDPFGLAVETARLTHGHPAGYLSAGVLALIINGLMQGNYLEAAICAALSALEQYPGHEDTREAVCRALALAQSSALDADSVSTLGRGWVGEEALAIALFCALKAEDFQTGVLAAVNHSGDSDSTGAICGNILGTRFGVEAISERWLANLEAREVIEQLAHDFISAFIAEDDLGCCSEERYPVF